MCIQPRSRKRKKKQKAMGKEVRKITVQANTSATGDADKQTDSVKKEH
jgi:hypothetical protein